MEVRRRTMQKSESPTGVVNIADASSSMSKLTEIGPTREPLGKGQSHEVDISPQEIEIIIAEESGAFLVTNWLVGEGEG
jgi:hypothetical protein